MQVIVKARHMKMTPPLHQYIDEKLVQALTRVFDDHSAELNVELVDTPHAKDGNRMGCNVQMLMPLAGGHRDNVVVHEVEDNMYKAIDQAHDRLLEQVKRHRDRHRASNHRRKNAAVERAFTARQELTSAPEQWERETQEFERSLSVG